MELLANDTSAASKKEKRPLSDVNPKSLAFGVHIKTAENKKMSIIIFLSGFTLIIIGLAIITFRLKNLVIKK
ncbi:putative internalin [Lactococcus lactis subsp. lactis]|nr:putative internalin [Lactococcus lactis subsp. lactis]MCT3135325.1 hypothetical protein [Lactococcus lactis]